MGFQYLTDAERAARAEAAMRDRHTMIEQWVEIPAEHTDMWRRRAELAADMLQGSCAVADIGCGSMSLERYVTARYIPVDVVRRDERTIVVDLNREPLPVMDVDAVACLGLLEYLHDVPGFLAQIQARIVVISYNPTDFCPMPESAGPTAGSTTTAVRTWRPCFAAGRSRASNRSADSCYGSWRLRATPAP